MFLFYLKQNTTQPCILRVSSPGFSGVAWQETEIRARYAKVWGRCGKKRFRECGGDSYAKSSHVRCILFTSIHVSYMYIMKRIYQSYIPIELQRLKSFEESDSAWNFSLVFVKRSSSHFVRGVLYPGIPRKPPRF